MENSITDKKVSHENMIFIVVATVILIALIFAVVAFIGLFRSNFYELMMESKNETVRTKN